MRVANLQGRAVFITPDDLAIDIEHASGGAVPCDPMQLFERWAQVRSLALTVRGGVPFALGDLDAPSPAPRQIFGIGLNYREHAVETGAPIPDTPLTFTKFASAINKPFGDIIIDVPTADWEIELVVVVGAGGRNIAESAAWAAVAGLCVGQDISDRVLQRATQPPQFSLGKSRRGYAPFGPWLVDAETVANRDALALTCTLNSEVVQQSDSSDLIFSIPQLVAYLSGIVELYPGDVIFTGTPSGVGGARTPPRFLTSGDVLVSTIDGVGSITNRCV
jgi:2-keto-4-pentenoate hydratase/2-oxohepta-3-ene-1,7-dioic acid hydratase in catechol pathway